MLATQLMHIPNYLHLTVFGGISLQPHGGAAPRVFSHRPREGPAKGTVVLNIMLGFDTE